MQQCKTCKFWEAGRFVGGWGRCRVIEPEVKQPPEERALIVTADPDSMLATSPAFGCVLHEPKEV